MKIKKGVALLFFCFLFISCHKINVTDISVEKSDITQKLEEDVLQTVKSDEKFSSGNDNNNSVSEVIVNFSPSKKVSNTFFELYLDETMDVEEANSLIFKDIENQDEVIFYSSYRLSYADEKIVMYAIVKLNDEQNEIINTYMKNNNINVDYISLSNHWRAPLDFYENGRVTITEYIRNLANEWCTDDFGFFIDGKNKEKNISYMNIYFENIYSTYIDKGGNTTSWRKENVKEFEDQGNPGIQFYYLMEESMKTIELIEPEDVVSVMDKYDAS